MYLLAGNDDSISLFDPDSKDIYEIRFLRIWFIEYP